MLSNFVLYNNHNLLYIFVVTVLLHQNWGIDAVVIYCYHILL